MKMGSASSVSLAGVELRLCHGDEFLLVAARRELEECEMHLSTKFEKRRTGKIGYVEECATEMEILQRVARLNRDFSEIALGADPRLVTELLQMFNMEECDLSASPRQRLDDKEVHRVPTTPLLHREASLKYHSATIGPASLAVDCPEMFENGEDVGMSNEQAQRRPRGTVEENGPVLGRNKTNGPVVRKTECTTPRKKFWLMQTGAGEVQNRRSTTGMANMSG